MTSTTSTLSASASSGRTLRIKRAFEPVPRVSVPTSPGLMTRALNRPVAGAEHKASSQSVAASVAAGVQLGFGALLQRPRLESNIAPPGARRGDAMAAAVGGAVGVNEQFRLRHRENLLGVPRPYPSRKRESAD